MDHGYDIKWMELWELNDAVLWVEVIMWVRFIGSILH